MGSCSTFVLHCHYFVVSVTLALDVERTCELAERLDLVHHISEAAISDWYTKEPSWQSHVVGPGCQKSGLAKPDQPDQFLRPSPESKFCSVLVEAEVILGLLVSFPRCV